MRHILNIKQLQRSSSYISVPPPLVQSLIWYFQIHLVYQTQPHTAYYKNILQLYSIGASPKQLLCTFKDIGSIRHILILLLTDIL